METSRNRNERGVDVSDSDVSREESVLEGVRIGVLWPSIMFVVSRRFVGVRGHCDEARR